MFKTIRTKRGLATKYVAEKLGIKLSTLYKYEECHSIPSASILLKMQEVYNCSHEELFEAYKYSKGVYDERKTKTRNKQVNKKGNRTVIQQT